MVERKCQMLNVGKRQLNLNLWRIQVSEEDKDRKETVQMFKAKIQEKCLESKQNNVQICERKHTILKNTNP